MLRLFIMLGLPMLAQIIVAAEIEMMRGNVITADIIEETDEAVRIATRMGGSQAEMVLRKPLIHRIRPHAEAAWRVITPKAETAQAPATSTAARDPATGPRPRSSSPSQITAPAGRAWVGYGGPGGSRVFPEARPPQRFDMTDGSGVRFDVVMPSWSHSSPIVVGDRVFLTVEVGPNNIFPMLVCVDGRSGEILWQREIDHLPAMGHNAATQHQIRADMKSMHDLRAQAADEAFAHRQANPNDRRLPVPERNDAFRNLNNRLREQAGIRLDVFRINQYAITLACFGHAFATPVSDGEHVFVTTAWGGHACFDLDGNLRWVQYVRGERPDWNPIGRSPILHDGMLLHNADRTLRALDARTGQVLWTGADQRGYSMVSPAVLSINGQSILLTAGPTAYHLPSGRQLTIEGWQDEGMLILVKHDEPDVAFFCGSGEHCGWSNKGDADPSPPAAVRFALDGDTLRATVLWQGNDILSRNNLSSDNRNLVNDVRGGNAPWMVYHDNRFFHRHGALLEPLTGRIQTGQIGRRHNHNRSVPETEHLLQIANGHVYGMTKTHMHVYAIDGNRVASNQLLRREPDEQAQAILGYATGNPRYKMDGNGAAFSYAHAFTFGHDAIYIRSYTNLIAIGR